MRSSSSIAHSVGLTLLKPEKMDGVILHLPDHSAALRRIVRLTGIPKVRVSGGLRQDKEGKGS